jgi:hypothetical protein
MYHHAFLVVGNHNLILDSLESGLKNPDQDIFHMRGERMGIDDVRTILHEAYLTPLIHEHRSFVIMYDDLTHEAQNALLKLFEEPPHTARFYLCIDLPSKLLPTLRSRLQEYRVTKSVSATKKIHDSFFSGNITEKLAYITACVRDETGSPDTLFNEILEYARMTHNTRVLKSALEFARTFRLPGASKKMILEHLALLLSEK